MSFDADTIYALLPAIYRTLDQQRGGPLKALVSVLADTAGAIEEDLDQRYDDHFIETCAPWVVPYIGDLVGTTPLFDKSRVAQPDTARSIFPDFNGPALIPEVALRGRADVAKTIDLRRRKATAPMLEELAHLVTGWASHVVEFFQILGWTQWIRNHLRTERPFSPDLRKLEPLDRVQGPFDTLTHTVDVRRISQLEGWQNIQNIGFFLWRLISFEIHAGMARRVGAAGDYRYHVSPLGNPAPLFSKWRPRGNEAGLSTEPHIPGPIRAAAFYNDLSVYFARPIPRPGFTEFYGRFGGAQSATLPEAPDASLLVVRDGNLVPPDQIGCMDLSTWAQPPGQVVGIDVKLGRLSFGTGWVPASSVEVYYHYGFPASLGGGPYARRSWQVQSSLAHQILEVDRSGATPGSFATIALALSVWATTKENTIISIVDSGTYQESLTIEPRDDRWLVIEAADRARPHLRLGAELTITGNHPTASVTLSGLLIEGSVHVTGSLGRMRIVHSTLVPGRALDDSGLPATSDPSLVVDSGAGGIQNDGLRVEIAFSILGPLRLPAHAAGLWLLDSIVDGLTVNAIAADTGLNEPACPGWIERSTIFGPSYFTELTLATEVIFTGAVQVTKRQEGCVRFSFVPPKSSTPRRFRCQPDLGISEAIDARAEELGRELTQAEKDEIAARVKKWLLPTFTTTRYGQPAYAQLHLSCPKAIAQGAEDGSEMGVYCHLKQPQRVQNLLTRLDEYLPFGMQPGIIFVT